MLYEPRDVRSERPVDGIVARGRAREPLERGRIPVVAEGGARTVEAALPEERRRRGPCGAVAVEPVGPRLGAEREELGEVCRPPRPSRSRRRARARAPGARRRAGAPRRRPPERTDGHGRSGGGTPRRSSRRPARTAGRRRGRRTPARPGARPEAGARRPTAGSPRQRPPRSPGTASLRCRGEERLDGGDGRVDVLVRVRGRREEALELRGRQVDARRQQMPEQRAEPLGVAGRRVAVVANRRRRGRRASASPRRAARPRRARARPRAARRSVRARRRRVRRGAGAGRRSPPPWRAGSPRACPPGRRRRRARAAPSARPRPPKAAAGRPPPTIFPRIVRSGVTP